MVSQITGISIVYPTVFFQAHIKENTQARGNWSLSRNLPVTSEFPAHRASNEEKVSKILMASSWKSKSSIISMSILYPACVEKAFYHIKCFS